MARLFPFKVLTVRIDQGVSYWRVVQSTSPKKFPTWFDFFRSNVDDRVKAIVEMTVPIEGGLYQLRSL